MKFDRGPGYYLGSIYFNYGLTALLVTALFLGLFLGAGISPDVLLWPIMGLCLLFPLWFFRYARSLWLGFDQYFDPQHPAPASRNEPPQQGQADSADSASE